MRVVVVEIHLTECPPTRRDPPLVERQLLKWDLGHHRDPRSFFMAVNLSMASPLTLLTNLTTAPSPEKIAARLGFTNSITTSGRR